MNDQIETDRKYEIFRALGFFVGLGGLSLYIKTLEFSNMMKAPNFVISILCGIATIVSVFIFCIGLLMVGPVDENKRLYSFYIAAVVVLLQVMLVVYAIYN